MKKYKSIGESKNIDKDISVIMPVCNEAESLQFLCGEVVNCIEELNMTYEMIFVDAGSRDNSFEVLCHLREMFKQMLVIKLKKQYGQSVALAAGIYYSRGGIVITMDADLQNNPKDISLFINKVKEGYDIVCGWRKTRQDPYLTKVLFSIIGNKILSRLSRIRVHDFSCTFKAFKKDAAKKIGNKLHSGLHRFIPLIARNFCFSICEIKISHRPRLYGKSKYSFFRVFKALIDYLILKIRGDSIKDVPKERLLLYIEKIII